MKTPYYYKSSTSGRTVFVLFEKGKSGDDWSNQKLSVKKRSISGLKPFSKLKGTKVELNGHTGIIKECCPYDIELDGKYLGEGKYIKYPEYLSMNNLVRVYWETGMQSCWQPYTKLKIK